MSARVQAVCRKSRCQSCGAPIVWIKTVSGKSMPCNASPVYYTTVGGDDSRIVTMDGITISCEIITDTEKADGFGYIPHWGSCPGADKFKKGATP